MKDKISVIVPVYNCEAYLSRCIRSILAQTYPNFELLLINDGSTDKSADICKDYENLDKRIAVINQTNKGVSIARNKGIDIAKGEYITFIDADDWIAVDAFEKMINIITTNKVDCIRTSYFNSTHSKDIPALLNVNSGLYVSEDIPELIKAVILGKIPGYTPLLFIRSSALGSDIRFNQNIKMMEDTCFYLDLLIHIDSIYLLNTPTYHYFLNTESASRSARHYIRNINDVMSVNERIKLKLQKVPSIDKRFIKAVNATHANIIANYLFTLFEKSPRERARLIEIFNLLYTNNTYKKLVSESDLAILAPHLRFSINAIIRHNYRYLLLVFGIRLVIKRLRGAKG